MAAAQRDTKSEPGRATETGAKVSGGGQNRNGEIEGDSLDRIAQQVQTRDKPLRLTGLRGASRALVGARLANDHGDAPVLFLTANAKAADALLDDLRTCLGEREHDRRTRAFPRHDTLPYERFSPQPFVVAQRMDVLYRWLAAGGRSRSTPAPIVVAPWTALALRVPSREAVRARSIHLEVAQSVDRDALVETLVTAGYARMSLVEEPGEIAVRGGIVDIFPPQLPRPIRIELLGDEIESIREFDSASQRSQDKLASAVAPPPRELLFDRDAVMKRSDAIRELGKKVGAPPGEVDPLIDALLRGHVPPGAEAIAPLLQPGQESVFDFLPDDTLVVLDDPEGGRSRLHHYFEEAAGHFLTAAEAGRVVAPPDDLLVDPDAFEQALRRRNPVSLERLDIIQELDDAPDAKTARFHLHTTAHDDLRRELLKTRTHDRALLPLSHYLTDRIRDRYRIAIICSSLSSADRLQDLLKEYDADSRVATEPRPISRWSAPGRIEVRVAPLSMGFDLPAEQLTVLTEEEIFGRREKKRRRASWRDSAAIDGLGQLAVGDFLVHVDHGIGAYRGLVELAVGGLAAEELLAIEYEGGDRLFLPVDRLNLVQRYGGADGVQPRLDRLGGDTWERAKKKVKKSLRMMASELLSVHAARELAPGFTYSPRDAYFEEFEAAFPFEETPDQAEAIEDVLADMQKPQPMDRLVCGDVGYGKTEVSVRAAFRAVMDGKQVAVLVPTTILCQQHEETFRERLKGYPVEIESLSRFRTPKDSKTVAEGLASGRVDIVIGTHRLLQKRVAFRDLGLLVIDEEHRFGVAHKEKIKKLKKTVDVLTLTATPIPRTLQLSFTGIRDLSLIHTAPVDRMAVRTQVARFDEALIREAILREVRRGGQVYFMHNRVRTIEAMAEMLAREVPDVKVIVAHGQMRERDLEAQMLAFQHGEADVLLCTTIIESGLDIPRANTIIINRADALGLAQLYQLRGRVGRSSQRAYAYLLIPSDPGALSEDARKRLEAIQDLSELGSGFRLANMDLEIRGAGNLLGSEQSGNLRSVGYETYMELLEETIEELRGNITKAEIDPEIRLPVVARLPEAYVSDTSQRLVLYKRLASSRDEGELAFVRDEILDRFGPLPREAENLIEVIRLKIMARSLGVVAISSGGKGATREVIVTVSESPNIDPQRLVQLMTRAGANIRVTPDHKIHAPGAAPGAPPPAVFDAAQDILIQLGATPVG